MVYPDGGLRIEVPHDQCRFRITLPEEAKRFRHLRSFLGTSRMAYRKQILLRIGSVPEALTFEADEYLFTLAGFLADVVILGESLTFYRIHDGNLFQFSNENSQATRRKQRVLAALAQSLRIRLEQDRVPPEVARAILECVEVEADILRLMLDSGFPWETVLTELKIMRIFERDASFWQHLFSYARLLPAIALPAGTYYHWRKRLSQATFYQAFRRKFMPFPVQSSIKRIDKPAP